VSPRAFKIEALSQQGSSSRVVTLGRSSPLRADTEFYSTYADFPTEAHFRDEEYEPASTNYNPNTPLPSRSPSPIPRPHLSPPLFSNVTEHIADWLSNPEEPLPPLIVPLNTGEPLFLPDLDEEAEVPPTSHRSSPGLRRPITPTPRPNETQRARHTGGRPLKREEGFFDVTVSNHRPHPPTPVVHRNNRPVHTRTASLTTSDVVSDYQGYLGAQPSPARSTTAVDHPSLPDLVDEFEVREHPQFGLTREEAELIETANLIISFASGRAKRALPIRQTLARDLVITIIFSTLIAAIAIINGLSWTRKQNPTLL
jgi:hypothetical protein